MKGRGRIISSSFLFRPNPLLDYKFFFMNDLKNIYFTYLLIYNILKIHKKKKYHLEKKWIGNKKYFS